MKTKTENIKAELEGSGFNVDVYECGQYRNVELKGKYNTEIDLPEEYLAIIVY